MQVHPWLVQFGTQPGYTRTRLLNIPLEQINHLSFAIGVDESANANIEARGDLDPNSRMARNREVGDKLVLFEGNPLRNGRRYPLVYHIGLIASM